MKMLLIMCSDVIAEDLRKVIDDIKLDCYLEVPKAHGCAGDFKRMDSYAFPGTANLFFVPCPDEKLDEIVARLQQYRDRCKYDKCMRMVTLNVDKVF